MTVVTQEERLALMRAENREFIMNADAWPRWPMLPMKKPRPEGGWPQLGALLDTWKRTGTEPGFPIELIVYDDTGLRQQEIRTYATVDDILNDGWIVD